MILRKGDDVFCIFANNDRPYFFNLLTTLYGLCDVIYCNRRHLLSLNYLLK